MTKTKPKRAVDDGNLEAPTIHIESQEGTLLGNRPVNPSSRLARG